MTSEVELWVRRRVTPVGALEVTHDRPWATVMRVPTTDGVVWFKACARVQGFEPRLTAELCRRWPDRMPELLGYDESRRWLLLADAGTVVRDLGNPPVVWEVALPRYAELQRGECGYVPDHMAHGVPDLRVATLPTRFSDLLQPGLPLDPHDVERLRAFEPTFAALCEDLAERRVPESVQHDDLHHANLYLKDGQPRILDWGDASISHPFASLVVTFRFLERVNRLAPDDPWFRRLRDAYLEPWGRGLEETFHLALRVGIFAHAIAWIRQRRALPDAYRPRFDEEYRTVLARALAQTHGAAS